VLKWIQSWQRGKEKHNDAAFDIATRSHLGSRVIKARVCGQREVELVAASGYTTDMDPQVKSATVENEGNCVCVCVCVDSCFEGCRYIDPEIGNFCGV
jgi:hypothetical protein